MLTYVYQGHVFDEYLARIDTPTESGVYLERVPDQIYPSVSALISQFTEPSSHFPMCLIEAK